LIKQKRKEGRAYIKCLSKDDENDQKLLKVAKKLAKHMNEVLENCTGEKAADEEVKEAHESKSDEISKIKKWLTSQKFGFASGVAEQSCLAKKNSSEKMSKEKLQRLKKEISILSNSLPDGIFVKVDEDRYDVMLVMIIGPEGTPYENGCFLFDLVLPENFPQGCPKMKFLTTGGGQFYFNPNLYRDGKVCLSLLGTWDGPGWDPETSTLLQLLVSLQGMVFVDYPLENEPGYEGMSQDQTSIAYNKGIRHATLRYTMIWPFENASQWKQFEAEAKLYLYSNKDRILNSQFTRWEALNAQCTENQCSYMNWTPQFNEASFKDMIKQLTGLLKDIPDKSYE